VAEVRLGQQDGEQCYHTSILEVDSLSSLRYVVFYLPMQQEKELRVWVHRSQGNATGTLPVLVEVESGEKTMQFDLKLSGGQILLPLDTPTCCLKMSFCSTSA
jgi:hypothetical protein